MHTMYVSGCVACAEICVYKNAEADVKSTTFNNNHNQVMQVQAKAGSFDANRRVGHRETWYLDRVRIDQASAVHTYTYMHVHTNLLVC